VPDYSFFLSYARVNRELDSKLDGFYKALVEAVFSRVGGHRNDVGFLDTEDIPPGGEWRDAIVTALGSSRAFVPLYTASYFERANCGKEWGAFRGRAQGVSAPATGREQPAVVLPILWADAQTFAKRAPKVVQDANYYLPPRAEHMKVYQDVGLLQMLKLSWCADACQEIVADLARRIVMSAEVGLPPLAVDSLDAIPNVFEIPAREPIGAGPSPIPPDMVQIIVVAGTPAELAPFGRAVECYGPGGESWMPFQPPNQARVAALAQNAISELNWASTIVPVDERLMDYLEKAESENRIVALIVDAWSLQVERLGRELRRYDEKGKKYLNLVVLVPWNLEDKQTVLSRKDLQRRLERTFARSTTPQKDPQVFLDEITSGEQFTAAFSQALEASRGRVIQYKMKRMEPGATVAPPPPALNNG
jgi:FxsC-like protein